MTGSMRAVAPNANNVDPNRIINPAFGALRDQLKAPKAGKKQMSPKGYVRVRNKNNPQMY